jgi:hypothetical protein
MEGADAINWADGNSGAGIDHSAWNYSMYRLSDQFSSLSLFGTGGLDVMASKQGTVGNCYLLAASTAVGAKNQSTLENAFCNQDQLTSNGGWVDVNMYAMNVPITIRVDDNVPFQIYSTSTFTSRTMKFAPLSNNRGAWVPILEKAFAKYRGSYGALDMGTAADGFSSLLGYPISSLNWSYSSTSASYIPYADWAVKLEDAVANNAMVSALTSSYNTYNIPTNHWYSVLGVYDVPRVGSTIKYRLIKLRNPWG